MILSISHIDYANFMYDNTCAMLSAGMNVKDVCLKKHDCDYQNRSEMVSIDNLLEYAGKADIIQIFHSSDYIFNLIKKINKPFTVWHTGGRYRGDVERMNQIFKNAAITFTNHSEFFLIPGNKFTYVERTVKVPEIKNKKPIHPILFAHYPSNPEIKGTETIEGVFNSLNLNYKLDKTLVNNSAQQKRVHECDVYVELFKPDINGNPYGNYGVAALEAAAMGKIVVTQNTNPEVYRYIYGVEIPFIIVNSEEELKEKLYNLSRMPIEEIEKLQAKTKRWVIDNHSHQATGKRLKKIFNDL